MKHLLNTLVLLFAAALSVHGQASFFDPTFGTGGKTIVSLGATESGVFQSLAIQPDGKIVAAGGNLVARFKNNGTPDTSFATNGFYTCPIGGELFDLILQLDGKVLLAGNKPAGNQEYFTVRLNSNGTLDATFGTGGLVTTDLLPLTDDRARGIALQADGKIVLAGAASLKIGCARLRPNGIVDSSFGNNGIVADEYGNVYAVDITPDGKIVMGGHANVSMGYALMALRYLPDGTLDTTFNHTGIAYTPAGAEGNFGRTLKVQPDGKVLLAGSGGFGPEGGNFVVVRYNPDGSLDGTFGVGGIADVDFSGQNDEATDMRITSDGKIILAGYTGDNVDYAVTRLNSNGTVDNSFGAGGKIVVPIRLGADYASAVALQSDGKIVLAGHSVKDISLPYTDPVVARLSAGFNSIKEDAMIEDQVRMFPNPASDILFVRQTLQNPIAGIFAVDLVGRKIGWDIAVKDDLIDISSLPNGTYLFEVLYADGRAFAQKIVVQNK